MRTWPGKAPQAAPGAGGEGPAPPRPLEAALAFRASSRRSERCSGITDPYPELAAGSVSTLQIGWGVLCHFPKEEEGKRGAGAKEGVSSPGRWVQPPGCPLARLSCRQRPALRAGEKPPLLVQGQEPSPAASTPAGFKR